MSQHVRSIELPEPLHLRDDGRTVEGLMVPWNSPADVAEMVDGKVERYREAFLPTSFETMRQHANKRGNWGWIQLNMDHEHATDKLAGFVRNVELLDVGARAEFRLYRGRNLELFQSMIEESHSGLSVEFSDIAPAVDRDGVRFRTQVYVDAVAATHSPVYAGAGVTAIRSESGAPVLETPMLDELQQWLAEQGGVES